MLVIGEMRQGIARLARRDPAQGEILGRWFGELVDVYSDRFAPVTADMAELWGQLKFRTRCR